MTTRAPLNGTGAAEMEFEASHYSTPEMEEEWEVHEGSPYSNPYSTPEMEEEWEVHEGSPYSNPYSNPEMEEEWEVHEGSPYSNPYSNPYSTPEMEEEWEVHEGSPHSNPYSNPEMEYEADRFIPLIAKAATKLLPHAVRLGRGLFRRLGRGSSQQPGSRATASGRSQQIAALFHRLGRLFAQGESEVAAHEAQLFGANEFETEVTGHEAAHQAALTEVMAAEASHTESESEAQALLGAALPISVRVMGGRVDVRRLTPALVRVNARLVLNLHRQGRPGRELLRVIPAIQRRALATIRTIQRAGQPVTPALAARVMNHHAAQVLTTPHICRQALVRNMTIRNRTVAPGRASVRPRQRIAS